MEILFTPIALIALVLYVAAPLLKESAEAESDEMTALGMAQEEKDRALANLKDIEMDYRMSKLSDEDYQRLKNEFEVRAVQALEKVEGLSRGKRKHKRRS